MSSIKGRKYKILCFVDYNEGRDVEILIPLVYYTEKYLNSVVEFAFISDIHQIYRKKPDLVLLANAIGSKLHFLITKYAYENNIPVFTLISEGNFRTDGTFNYWGYNTDKTFYQEFICHWSKRTCDFLNTVLPEYKAKNVVTGATGFDRYKIYDFIHKNDYLRKIGYPTYKKVISYAGWSFGKLFNKTGLIEVRNTHKDKADARIKWMKKQMVLVENILRKTIENNPDILFILKRHPNEIHPHLRQPDKNEMVNLKNYNNVLYTIDENIHDMISASDIFLGFETTTALETWVMKDTPTILINPDEDFLRDKLYKGSVIAHNYNELQNFIDEFYSIGKIKSFFGKEKVETRNQLITDTIGFADGMNHLRAGYYLEKTLSKINRDSYSNVKFSFRHFIWHILIHIGKYFYVKKIFEKLPKFKKTIWIFDNLKLKKLPEFQKRYYGFLDRFHNENKIEEKIKEQSFWERMI